VKVKNKDIAIHFSVRYFFHKKPTGLNRYVDYH